MKTPTLFHGTSSIFLPGILEKGLGGSNPLLDLDIYNLSLELLPFVEALVERDPSRAGMANTFKFMALQKSEGLNFQHGDTYLTACERKAVSHAAAKEYGSEIVTYALRFLRVLSDNNVEGINNTLYQKYPQVFQLMDVSPTPLLISIEGRSGPAKLNS